MKMKKTIRRTVLSAVLAACALPTALDMAFAQSRSPASPPAVTVSPGGTIDPPSSMAATQGVVSTVASEAPALSAIPNSALRKYSFTFRQLGALDPLQLRGVDPISGIPFSIPNDEVVTAVKLKLDIAYSPSLITNLSHLKVLINGELAATIPLPKEQAGASVIKEVSIDPRLITDFNRMNLQFIGHYTLECEDPFHSSLWLNISNLSSVEFTVTPLAVQNDLALLPAPFFDRRDGRRLELPFFLPPTASNGMLEAAGIVSSWFGALASYRGAWFPATSGTLPNDDTIVFATNEERPAGVTIPPISGPSLAIGAHPGDSRYKILYVMGRDVKELRTAATALSLGRSTFSGPSATISKLDDLKVRAPYDAPNWIASNRPVKFGELASVEDLNVRGYSPDLVRVNLRLPPDLFGWKSDGIPLHLSYRYSPRPRPDKSTLNINVNRNYITSYPLLAFPRTDAGADAMARFVNKLLPDKLIPAVEDFYLPINQIPARSQLQFHFNFDYPKEGACKDVLLDNVRAAIDQESTVDLSSFPHYIQMPNLSAFANAGYPFTRMADLSETAVIIPDTPGVADISTYLSLMGRMGESTGLPVYGLTVGKAADVQRVGDKDLLLLGGTSNQPLLSQWAGNMPFSASGQIRTFSLSDWILKRMPWYEEPRDDKKPVAKLSAVSLNRDAVLFGFESPLKSGRSVVAIISDKTVGMADVLNALMDSDLVSKIHGSLAIIRGKEVESMALGNTYYVGSLPPLTALRWFLSGTPWLIAALLLVAAAILGTVMYAFLRRKANKRITGK